MNRIACHVLNILFPVVGPVKFSVISGIGGVFPCQKCHFFFLFVFRLFRVVPEAYGDSQAKDRIAAVAAGHSIATAAAMQDPSHVCDLHHRSRKCGILNSLSKARDRT